MSITRRLFLKSTPAALAVGTTVAAPAVIEASESEHPCAKATRLAYELSDAMHGYNATFGGEWQATVRASGTTEQAIWFMSRASWSPEDRVARAQQELIEATKALHPEVSDWRVMRGDEVPEQGNTVGLFMVIGRRPRRSKVGKAVRS